VLVLLTTLLLLNPHSSTLNETTRKATSSPRDRRAADITAVDLAKRNDVSRRARIDASDLQFRLERAETSVQSFRRELGELKREIAPNQAPKTISIARRSFARSAAVISSTTPTPIACNATLSGRRPKSRVADDHARAVDEDGAALDARRTLETEY
jgi:hypothetical protein